MGCMGADMSHAAPLADRMTHIIIATLKERGFERPDNFFGMGEDWDAEVEKIRDALRAIVELDAANKF